MDGLLTLAIIRGLLQYAELTARDPSRPWTGQPVQLLRTQLGYVRAALANPLRARQRSLQRATLRDDLAARQRFAGHFSHI